jgi:hypothetical protein
MGLFAGLSLAGCGAVPVAPEAGDDLNVSAACARSLAVRPASGNAPYFGTAYDGAQVAGTFALGL